MDSWLSGLLTIQSPLQTVVVLALICCIGLALGKIRIKGISLGIAFVFFVGIIVGNFHIEIDPKMLAYAETFGLVLFVYTLGLYVGPNFLGSLRHEGVALNLWSIAVALVGTALAFVVVKVTNISVGTTMGLLCGAVTNTPALGAAQQALEHLGLPTKSMALACAVTYPLGVVGVIFALILLRKVFVSPHQLTSHTHADEDHTYIVQFEVSNPDIHKKTLAQVAQMVSCKFIVSRIWRDGQTIVPHSPTQLHLGDNVLVATTDEQVDIIKDLFGTKVEKDWNKGKIDWDHIDTKLESKVVVLTRPGLNGKKLGSLHLRNIYDVNVSRVIRGDIKLLATQNLRLQYGDRLTIVGEHGSVKRVERFLGNAVKTLSEPNLGAIFLGMILGLALGTIPIYLPGMDAPVRLGIAGGPIVMGIIMGALCPRLHIISYTTRSASLMLRQLGLSLYLACLGLDAGGEFLSTVMRPEGLLWLALGLLLTMIPVLVVGAIILKRTKLDFGSVCGILCGAMANPMALTYATDTIEGDSPAVSYATVYPFGMFLRVIIAQVFVMFLV